MNITQKLVKQVKKHNAQKWHDQAWHDFNSLPEVCAVNWAISETKNDPDVTFAEIVLVAKNF